MSRMQRWSFMVQTGALAGLAGQLRFGLQHRRRETVQRRPVIGTGRAENAHGRRADRGRDMHQAGIVRDGDAGCRHRQNAVAQIGAGEVADLAAARGDDLLRQRLFAGTADHPDIEAALGQQPRGFADNRSSAWRRRPSPAPAPPRARCRARWPGASGPISSRGTASCGTGHSGGSGAPCGQRQRGILVDETGQGLLAPAHPVDQPEPRFAEKAHPFRDAGQCRRNRRFPGAGQDEGGSVAPGAQFRRQTAIAWPPQAGCGAGPRRSRRGRPACNRPAARRGRSPAGRPAGSASAASGRAPPYGRGRSRRSTYRERSGSAGCRRRPPSRSHLVNYDSYLDKLLTGRFRPRR